MQFTFQSCMCLNPQTLSSCPSKVSSHKILCGKIVKSQILKEDWVVGKNHLSYHQVWRQEAGYTRPHLYRRICRSVQRAHRWTYLSNAFMHRRDAGDLKSLNVLSDLLGSELVKGSRLERTRYCDKVGALSSFKTFSSKIGRISDAPSPNVDSNQRKTVRCLYYRDQKLF